MRSPNGLPLQRPNAGLEQVHRGRRLHTRRTAGPVEEQGELLGVERITIEGELVVPAVRDQPVAEHPAQIRDVGPHDVRCRGRRCVAPDLLDDAVDAERPGCGGQEAGQDVLLAGSAQIEGVLAVGHPERTEDLEPHSMIASSFETTPGVLGGGPSSGPILDRAGSSSKGDSRGGLRCFDDSRSPSSWSRW